MVKGLRKRPAGQNFLEIGFLAEADLYFRSNRELHTLGAINVLEYFPSIRKSLIKSAVRDTAFELLLSAITVSDPHPEMFGFICNFLTAAESRDEDVVYPWLLWRFYIKFAAMSGFSLNMESCVVCGKKTETGGGDGVLNAAKGGIECRECSKNHSSANRMSGEVAEFLRGHGTISNEVKKICRDEKKKITRLLDMFCRYHCEVKTESKALGFLESIRVTES
jgi:DNA repair protein RecO